VSGKGTQRVCAAEERSLSGLHATILINPTGVHHHIRACVPPPSTHGQKTRNVQKHLSVFPAEWTHATSAAPLGQVACLRALQGGAPIVVLVL
jgi:hypothetical protein